MNSVASSTAGAAARWTLTAGLMIAVLMDALNATIFSVARWHIIGDMHATPDEGAWVNLSYLIGKLCFLPPVAWVVDRYGERRLLPIAMTVVAGTSILCASDLDLPLLSAARLGQGAGGAALLVSTQTAVFRLFRPIDQGHAQAIYGLGVVMAPVALAPAIHGWLAEHCSWTWSFWLNPAIAVVATTCIAPLYHLLPSERRTHRPFDWYGLALFVFATATLAYVQIEGPRWNWFEAPHIRGWALLGSGGLLIYGAVALIRTRRREFFNWNVFDNREFTFGVVVSLIAGFALFGSASLLPSFAIGALHLPPGAIGPLLAPASLTIGGGMLLGGTMMADRRIIRPLRLVPFGILLVMAAMWLLAGSNVHSGAHDLSAALLLRGLGFGILFISLTLMTLQGLDSSRLASGVSLFNFGRTLGGVIGGAVLRTYMDHRAAIERSHLIVNLDPANGAFLENHQRIVEILIARGYDPGVSGLAASTVVKSEVLEQAVALSFNAAFLLLAGLFVVVVPLVLAFRLVVFTTKDARLHGPHQHRARTTSRCAHTAVERYPDPDHTRDTTTPRSAHAAHQRYSSPDC